MKQKPKRPVAPQEVARPSLVEREVAAVAFDEPSPVVEETREPQRQSFLDQTAIAMFARGFPMRDLWAHCEKLWASREAFIRGSKS